MAGVASYFDSEGLVKTDQLIGELRTTKADFAVTIGLPKDAISKRSREYSTATQSRLRETIEIISRVKEWAGSMPAAYAWFRAQPLPSFGGRTAEDLVKDGHSGDVRAYLSRIAVGGYA